MSKTGNQMNQTVEHESEAEANMPKRTAAPGDGPG